MDLVIKNARLRNKEELCDIEIQEGKIVKICHSSRAKPKETIDVQGRLVTESFCNPHLHLCKVYTLHSMDCKAMGAYHSADMGAAMTAIELASHIKKKYDQEWIIKNVRSALYLAAFHGCFHIRAFADVDSKARLKGVEALLKAKEEFQDMLELQVVAFPQDGVIREPGTEDLMRKAMEMGADVVGGIPWIEFTDQDAQEHIDKMCDLALEYDKDVSMLVDDAGDPGLRTLEMLALRMIKDNRIGRALAHHARAMSLYPEPYFKKLLVILKRAKMGVVSDPHTGPLHAKVKEMLKEDALVCFGQDDIADAYYPFGCNNMLEVGFLNAHLLWMMSFLEMEKIYDMITVQAAQCMNIQKFGIQEGNPANLVVLNGESVYQALWYHRAPLYLIRHGKLLDKTKLKEKIKELINIDLE